MTEIELQLVKSIQTMFPRILKANPSIDEISVLIDKLVSFLGTDPKSFSKSEVIDELIRRSSIKRQITTVLSSNIDHKPWLNDSDKSTWRYWNRYRQYIEENYAPGVADEIDDSTDEILGELENPMDLSYDWDRRGLVVGNVQSGKTANYTGLICKAADAGYKLIIVLSGMMNSLRSQTQIRLDEGFLGFKSIQIDSDEDDVVLETIGVGNIDDSLRTQSVTNREEDGDFTKKSSRNLTLFIGDMPYLLVVKKNKTVLSAINNWLNKNADKYTEEKRPLITKQPILIIDDESDNGSVDTGKDVINEDGSPDVEHKPTTLNKLIRRLLFKFTHAAYVGYTATPFANIFIHEKGETEKEGPDIFPKSFICNLHAPENYFGPEKLFQTNLSEMIIKTISDYHNIDPDTNKETGGWMPTRHKKDHSPHYDSLSNIPPSLEDSILHFILACTARRLRGDSNKHSSMLIHVTRFIDVQKKVYNSVFEYWNRLRKCLVNHIDDSEILERMKQIWDTDYYPTSNKLAEMFPNERIQAISWPSLSSEIRNCIGDMAEPKLLNGDSSDVLDYEEKKDIGLKCILVGGDKFSRGLTLEGLCTSYFLRNSSAYDTLMQMGRWFGYRPKYIDLCRVFMPANVKNWFGQIAQATKELRNDFDVMSVGDGKARFTPKDFGIKVKTFPGSGLMVTSQAKSRSSTKIDVGLEGRATQTIVFRKEKSIIEGNYSFTQEFIRSLGIDYHRNSGNISWNNRNSDVIERFLNGYTSHEAATRVHPNDILMFMNKLKERGLGLQWNINVIGLSDKSKKVVTDLIPGESILCNSRTNNNREANDRVSIAVLSSPSDELIDLTPLDLENAKKLDAEGNLTASAVRAYRGHHVGERQDRCILNIVPLTVDTEEENPLPFIGYNIVFPDYGKGISIHCQANHVYIENYGIGGESDE